VLGGIKVGTNLSIDANGVLSATDTNTDALHDLTDVNISLPSDGQALLYDSTNNKWVNGDVAGSASDITYDNTDSGLTATDVQDAVDEVNADKADKTQITNPNLLDNPWFTVNQRGQSSYTYSNAQIYTIDRWALNYSGSVTKNTDGSITVANSNDTQVQLRQFFESDVVKNLQGRTVTLSCIVDSYLGANNKIRIRETKNNVFAKEIGVSISSTGIVSVTGTIGNDTDGLEVNILTFGGGSHSSTIKAVKLELGSISTLALDTAPNYATELLKCQRYCVVLGGETGFAFTDVRATNATTIDFYINLPTKMRAIPTITQPDGDTLGYMHTGVFINDNTLFASVSVIFNISVLGANVLVLRGVTTGLTADRCYKVGLNNYKRLVISADL